VIGNWMLTGKTYVVPAGDFTSTSYYGGFRRYFGGDGTSYWGASYGHGFSREEVHDIADLTTLASDSVRGEVDAVVGARLRLFASGGTARQEQTTPSALWQTTFSGGVTVLF
jgi:hypothetical protein